MMRRMKIPPRRAMTGSRAGWKKMEAPLGIAGTAEASRRVWRGLLAIWFPFIPPGGYKWEPNSQQTPPDSPTRLSSPSDPQRRLHLLPSRSRPSHRPSRWDFHASHHPGRWPPGRPMRCAAADAVVALVILPAAAAAVDEETRNRDIPPSSPRG